MLIGDMGSVRPGVPTLTVALRGMAMVTVELRTLESAKHSGQYGGAAPDALLALLRALASLHDDHGDVAVEGLRREEWTGGGNTEEEFRALAEVLEGLPLIGTGTLGSRVWSGPAITVTGIDVPSVDKAVNSVSPYARASLNLRVHPQQDAVEAQAALIHHLEEAMPFGTSLQVHAGATGNGFAARTDSPAYQAAREAWSAAWGAETVFVGSGGSIPLVNALSRAVPHADVLLVGTTDGYANIHGPNERVLLDEFEKTVLAEADLLGRLAGLRRGSVVSAETEGRTAVSAEAARDQAPKKNRGSKESQRAGPDTARAELHRAGGQQGAAPGHPVHRPHLRPHHHLPDPRLDRHQRHLRGGGPSPNRGGGNRLGGSTGPTRFCRPGMWTPRTTRWRRGRRRSRASWTATASAFFSPRSSATS